MNNRSVISVALHHPVKCSFIPCFQCLVNWIKRMFWRWNRKDSCCGSYKKAMYKFPFIFECKWYIQSTLFSLLVLFNSMATPLCVFLLCSPQSLLSSGSYVALSNGRVELSCEEWKVRNATAARFWAQLLVDSWFNAVQCLYSCRTQLFWTQFNQVRDDHYFFAGVSNFKKKEITIVIKFHR